MSDIYTGTVKWFNNKKGYGFIECPNHNDVFVYYKSIESQKGYKTLIEGQKVQFNLVSSGKKGFHAENVKVIEKNKNIKE